MRRLLIVLPLVLGAAGCSGGGSDSKPVTLPPLTAAPTTSAPPSPTVKPVKKPAKADEPTAEGAEAFARYWIEVVNNAHVRVDPTELRRISTATCQTCTAYAKSLDRARKEGRRYAGGFVEVKQAVATNATRSAAKVLVDYDVPPLQILNSAGAVLRTVPAESDVTLRFDLVHRGDRWVADEVAQV